MDSAFLCGMILFKPRPFHPIRELLGLFQTLTRSQLRSSYTDGQPKLSPDQQKNSCVWKRPNQRPGESMDILRQRILPEDILQHIVTDCSVCASISVCLEHSRRFGSTVSLSVFVRSSCLSTFRKLAVSSIHNYRNKFASKVTTTQIDGRYDIRALFNGAWRRVGSFFLVLFL